MMHSDSRPEIPEIPEIPESILYQSLQVSEGKAAGKAASDRGCTPSEIGKAAALKASQCGASTQRAAEIAGCAACDAVLNMGGDEREARFLSEAAARLSGGNSETQKKVSQGAKSAAWVCNVAVSAAASALGSLSDTMRSLKEDSIMALRVDARRRQDDDDDDDDDAEEKLDKETDEKGIEREGEDQDQDQDQAQERLRIIKDAGLKAGSASASSPDNTNMRDIAEEASTAALTYGASRVEAAAIAGEAASTALKAVGGSEEDLTLTLTLTLTLMEGCRWE